MHPSRIAAHRPRHSLSGLRVGSSRAVRALPKKYSSLRAASRCSSAPAAIRFARRQIPTSASPSATNSAARACGADGQRHARHRRRHGDAQQQLSSHDRGAEDLRPDRASERRQSRALRDHRQQGHRQRGRERRDLDRRSERLRQHGSDGESRRLERRRVHRREDRRTASDCFSAPVGRARASTRCAPISAPAIWCCAK